MLPRSVKHLRLQRPEALPIILPMLLPRIWKQTVQLRLFNRHRQLIPAALPLIQRRHNLSYFLSLRASCATSTDTGLVALHFRHSGESSRINRNPLAPARRFNVSTLCESALVRIAAKRAGAIRFWIHMPSAVGSLRIVDGKLLVEDDTSRLIVVTSTPRFVSTLVMENHLIIAEYLESVRPAQGTINDYQLKFVDAA